jgi:bacterioferritin
MARAELIENLNKALSLELSGVIQYTQHSFLITGPEREIYRGFFREQASEAQDHVEMVGDKIVALGGFRRSNRQ